MEKIAVYGKGGVGKSVVATSLSACYGMGGKRVLHIGCDPKHDSAIRLIDGAGATVRTVLEVIGDNPAAVATADILNAGRHGIDCCESGGPQAGVGCGGRGVARTIELLDDMEILQSGKYDVAIFDVLGDVVCGGFAAPLRDGFAEKVIIVVSEEPMALFAANNISRAVALYRRNGVALAGLVVNLRGKDVDPAPIERFAARIGTRVLATIEREPRVMEAERNRQTVVEYAADCAAATSLRRLAEVLAEVDASALPPPQPMADDEFFVFMKEMG